MTWSRDGIEFSTPENRPDKFELDSFPTQSSDEIDRLGKIIQNLIKETDLSTSQTRLVLFVTGPGYFLL